MGEIAAPHPSAPFTIGRDGTVVVEQGSDENITSNIYNIAVCVKGFRDDLPEFGVPDITFTRNPPDVEVLQRALERWEPAANLELESHRTAVAEAEVTINVS